MKRRNVIYSYPIWHTVSFSIVSKKHIEVLRKYTKVYEWDELNFPDIYPVQPYVLCIHPIFGSMARWIQKVGMPTETIDKKIEGIAKRFEKYECVIGFDVADSDRISELAVLLSEPCDYVVVPSRFCRDSFIRSGCRKKVIVLHHGLDYWWYDSPPTDPNLITNNALRMLYTYKLSTGRKIILFWLWHSPDRKGWPEVLLFFERLRKERNDIMLVVKTGGPLNIDIDRAKELGIINVFGWLSDTEKMFLFDISDLTLNFSRGGGFEINGLESLGRGTPVLAHRKGAWKDYMPDWLLVKEGLKVKVFEDNQIHVGYGHTVDIDDALDKACDILDNLDEYKMKTKEYAMKVLKPKFNWEVIGKQLWKIISEG